jgi:integrase
MEADRRYGKFDPTLQKYLSQQPKQPAQSLSLSELWDKYCDYKEGDRKAATMRLLRVGIGNHIRNCPHQQIDDSISIKLWLRRTTTPYMTRLVLSKLAALVKWGARHGLVSNTNNPFVDMATDMQLVRTETTPNAFSPAEVSLILNAFTDSRYYSFYAPLVRFLFLTGCRPSEAIGLEFTQISEDFSEIKFDRSIIHINGKAHRNQRSKTNRVRTFPCNNELQQMLRSLSPARKYSQLVFPSPNLLPINYLNFSQKAWKKTAIEAVGRDSTPYSCRDTFITDQISKGVPIAIIAKWVDNSADIIERHYFDPSALQSIRPR